MPERDPALLAYVQVFHSKRVNPVVTVGTAGGFLVSGYVIPDSVYPELFSEALGIPSTSSSTAEAEKMIGHNSQIVNVHDLDSNRIDRRRRFARGDMGEVTHLNMTNVIYATREGLVISTETAVTRVDTSSIEFWCPGTHSEYLEAKPNPNEIIIMPIAVDR